MGVLLVLFCIYAATLLLPLVWIFINSLKADNNEFFYFQWEFKKISFVNYTKFFTGESDIVTMLANTLILALTIPTAATFFGMCLGHAVGSFDYKLKNVIYFIFLLPMFVSIAGTTPYMYKLMNDKTESLAFGMQEHLNEDRKTYGETKTAAYIADATATMGATHYRLSYPLGDLFSVDSHNRITWKANKSRFTQMINELTSRGVTEILYVTDAFLEPDGYIRENGVLKAHNITVPHPIDEADPVLLMVDDILYKRLNVFVGENVNIFTAPTKEGYVFDKWLNKDGSEYDMNTAVNAPITLYASFKAAAPGESTEVETTVDPIKKDTENPLDMKYIWFSLIGLVIIAAETGIIIYKKKRENAKANNGCNRKVASVVF